MFDLISPTQTQNCNKSDRLKTPTITSPTLLEQCHGFFSKIVFKDEADKANSLMFSANDTIVCT